LSRGTDKIKDTFPYLEDFHFYDNTPLSYNLLPDFDAVLFTSPSTFDAFIKSFTLDALRGKTAIAIGKPTFEVLEAAQMPFNPLISPEAEVTSMLMTLASWKINCNVLEILNTGKL
jgi:uroporphyrinogen-III synthase